MAKQRFEFLPYLPLVIAPILLLSPVLFTGKVLFWGTVILQFFPWRYSAWEALRSGHLPLWNPHVGMGAPLAANYQSGLFYPPNWVLFGLAAGGGSHWMAWGQGIIATLHLIWAGIGMANLCRRCGINTIGQTIGGLAFGLSGYLVGRVEFFSIISTVAWLPWILVYSMPNNNDPPKNFWDRNTLKLCIVLTMQLLGGHAQTVWFSLLLAFGWSGFLGWHNPKSYTSIQLSNSEERVHLINKRLYAILYSWIRLIIAYLMAFGMAAIQLIPTIEYFVQSQRSMSIDYRYAMTYSFWPWRFLSFLAPNLFGTPIKGNYWGYGNYWEDHLYIGILPLLAGIGVIFSKKKGSIEYFINGRSIRFSALIPALFAISVVSFIFALGENTPVIPWLYDNLVTFDLFQAPTRYSIWAEISMCLLAGFGVSRMRRPSGKTLYWARLGTVGALALLVASGLTSYFLSDISLTFIHATAITGFFSAGTGILWLFSEPTSSTMASLSGNRESNKWNKSVWEWVLILFVGFDLMAAGWGLNPGENADLYNVNKISYTDLGAESEDSRIYLPPNEEYLLKYARFMRFSSYLLNENWANLRSTLLPNLNILDHIYSVNNYDPMIPSRYNLWMMKLSEYEAEADNVISRRLLNLSGISLVERSDKTVDNGVRFEHVEGSKRVRWVPCAWITKNPNDTLARLYDKDFEIDRYILLESKDSVDYPSCTVKDLKIWLDKVEIIKISEHHNMVIFKTYTPSDGWILLSDIWYPGWRASIDTKDTDLFRADFLFRAARLPAGEHVVVFSYQPITFYIGAIASLFFIVTVSLLWIRNRW